MLYTHKTNYTQKYILEYIQAFLKILAVVLFFVNYSCSMAPINLFRPSDRFLQPPVYPGTRFQLTVGYEYATRVRGFQDDHDYLHRYTKHKLGPVNVMQLYQCKQNLVAAFKSQLIENFKNKKADKHISYAETEKLANLVQLLNLDDDTGVAGRFIASGRFRVPVNALFSARWYFDYGLGFGLHIPYYEIELDQVKWDCAGNSETSETLFVQDIEKEAKRLGNLYTGGWKRKGFGDLIAQVTWNSLFEQHKPLLKCVATQARFGVVVPTGKCTDEDKLLAFALGNDNAWGVQVAGGLDLFFKNCFKGGIDAEFIYLFGNTRRRRIKTDSFQTDLLLFSKECAYKEFGVQQQYNMYVEWLSQKPGLGFKLNYQYLRRNDDRLYVRSDAIDSHEVTNKARSLYAWTTHSLIFNLYYDRFRACPESWLRPYVSLWYKVGLNGKNSLVADTIGATVSLNF